MRIPFILDHSYKSTARLEIPFKLLERNTAIDGVDYKSNNLKLVRDLEEFLINSNITFSTVSSNIHLILHLLNSTSEDVLSILLMFEGITCTTPPQYIGKNIISP
jgi:type IV secretory pathway VirB3-like protein